MLQVFLRMSFKSYQFHGSSITLSSQVGVGANAVSTTEVTNFWRPMGLHVSNDRVWVGNSKIRCRNLILVQAL